MRRPFDLSDPIETAVDQLDIRITYRGKVYGNTRAVLRSLARERGVLEQVLVDTIQPVMAKVIDDHTEKWIHITPGQDGQPAQMHWVEPPPNQR
jgi:hypothetical protein